MVRHNLPPRARRTAPIALILLVVVALFLGARALYAPIMSRLGLSGAEPLDAVAAGGPTEFVRMALQTSPTSRTGLCLEHSVYVPRTDAWRCGVGTEVIDPCFSFFPSPGGPRAVVCGAEPLSGSPGFLVEPGAGQPAARASSPPALDPASIESLTFTLGSIGQPVTLVNGQFYLPFVEALGSGVLVALSEMQATGDLDGDGDDDAAVLLVADAGDDSMYIYLGAVINDDGTPVSAGALELGDRVKVDNLQIEAGQIVVRMTTHAADDPECCPTLDVTYLYNLVGDRLVQYVDGWRLELADGVQCVPVLARQAANAEMPFAYQCSDGKWLRNRLHPGQVWYAAPVSAQGEATDPGEFVPVERIWQ